MRSCKHCRDFHTCPSTCHAAPRCLPACLAALPPYLPAVVPFCFAVSLSMVIYYSTWILTHLCSWLCSFLSFWLPSFSLFAFLRPLKTLYILITYSYLTSYLLLLLPQLVRLLFQFVCLFLSPQDTVPSYLVLSNYLIFYFFGSTCMPSFATFLLHTILF